MDLSTILVISDTQAPHNHPDVIQFLSEIKKQFKPTFVLHIGDLADFHRLNFHGANPNLPSAHEELINLRAFVKKLAKLFPSLVVVDSNHDALPRRKARSIGIPDEMLKDMGAIMEAPKTWKFVKDLIVKLPNGIKVKFKHNFGSNLFMDCIKQGISLVCGHLHTKANITWGMNCFHQHYFSMQVGCLIDKSHDAFEYADNNSTEEVLTVGIIKGGIPIIIPMYQDKHGRWKGFV